RIAQIANAGDAEPPRPGRRAGPGAVAARGPPPALQDGCGDDADDDRVVGPQCDQRRPDRYAADVVLRAVDRIDDPRARRVARRTGLFADDRVVRSFGGKGSPYGVLYGP